MSFQQPLWVDPPDWGEDIDPTYEERPPVETPPPPIPPLYLPPPPLPPPQPVYTMEPDQRAGYDAWLAAGAQGSPPAWVLEDRSATARQAAIAAAALEQLRNTPIPIQNAFDVAGTGPSSPLPPAPAVDIAPPPPQIPPPNPTPGNTMTFAQFSAAYPDLSVNWSRRNDPAYDGDFADWLRSLGTFENYLLADAEGKGITLTAGGGAPVVVAPPPPVNAPPPYTPPPYTPPAASTMPPLTIGNQTALAHAIAHPDLENNWREAWNNPIHQSTAIGVFIRAFPSFEAYVLDDIARRPAVNPPGGYTPPPVNPGGSGGAGMSNTAKGLLVAGTAIGLAWWLANRNRS
jgi:hypothetical protein